MGKNKLKRFAEMADFPNTFQYKKEMKGNWDKLFFKNGNRIVLELACGRGEYTIGLAQRNDKVNFIGIDLKGARLWRGAKTAVETGMNHVAFLRTQIEDLESYFDKDEVSEIWITFPDPFLKEAKSKKRLTSPRFIDIYRKIMPKGSGVNLKTDSSELFEYTLETLNELNIKPEIVYNDVYHQAQDFEALVGIQTTYENRWLKEGKKIKYIRFSI